MSRYRRACYRPGCQFVASSMEHWYRHRDQHAAEDKVQREREAS